MASTELDLQKKMGELRDRLIEVFIQFGMENPDMPALAHMGALGEMLIQFSVPQVGPKVTKELLDQLKKAVDASGMQRH